MGDCHVDGPNSPPVRSVEEMVGQFQMELIAALAELVAMHLHRLGAAQARSITFAGDGGVWIWERIPAIIADANRSTTQEAATRFEVAAGLVLCSTPGFEVLSSRKTSDQQTDLVVHYAPDRLTRLKLAVGPGLVECKSSAKPVGVDELRDFGAKCVFHRVNFGILVAHAGITGQGKQVFAKPEYAELVRRRFQVDGLTLLVLDIRQLRGKSRELRGLQDELAADQEYLVFGPKSGELDSSDTPKSSP